MKKLPEKFELSKSLFLKRLIDIKDPLIMAVWLYGSAARGEISERHSDIDFLVLFNGLRTKTRDAVEKIAAEVTAECKVNVHVEIMDYLVKKEVQQAEKEHHIRAEEAVGLVSEDAGLLQTVAREGDLLYSSRRFYLTAEGLTADNKLQRKGLGLKPYYLVEFNSASISASKKPALFRALYGSASSYKDKKGKIFKKTYGGSGKIIRMGRGAFLIGVDDLKDLETVLHAMGVEYHISRIVWI